jgi:hypothetical protein
MPYYFFEVIFYIFELFFNLLVNSDLDPDHFKTCITFTPTFQLPIPTPDPITKIWIRYLPVNPNSFTKYFSNPYPDHYKTWITFRLHQLFNLMKQTVFLIHIHLKLYLPVISLLRKELPTLHNFLPLQHFTHLPQKIQLTNQTVFFSVFSWVLVLIIF